MAVERVLQRCSCISRKWFLVFWLLPLPAFLRGLPRIQHKLSGIPNGGLLRPYAGNHPRKQLCCLRDDLYQGPGWDPSQSLGNSHHPYKTGRSPALRSLRFQPQQKPASESRRCLGPPSYGTTRLPAGCASQPPVRHGWETALPLAAAPAAGRAGGWQGSGAAGWSTTGFPKTTGKRNTAGEALKSKERPWVR